MKLAENQRGSDTSQAEQESIFADSAGSRLRFYPRIGKRLLDVLLVLVGLAFAWPLFMLSAVAIRLDSRGPVFFRQIRVGQFGKTFRIWKFRSMRLHEGKGALQVTAADDPRITRVGHWLRKAKLDEIPQLLNVLWGEMSLVGPRPETPEYVFTYNVTQEKVLLVKPGVTGPATLTFVDEEKVLARAPDKEDFYLTTLMPRKLELDLAYCKDVRISEDLRLILRTLLRLIWRPE